MNFLQGRHFRIFLFVACFFLLSACASTPSETSTSTDPQPMEDYVLVTANPQATSTPFQPSQPTNDPGFVTEMPMVEASELETETPQPGQTPTVAEPGLATETAQAGGQDPATELPEPTELSPLAPTRPQYELSALMDYAGHRVTVSEQVVYPNRSPDTLASIAFGVNPNLWSGVFSLQKLAVNGQASNNYSLDGQWLSVNLDAPLQPGQSVKIGIDYSLTLPYSSMKGENFGYTGRQTNLIDWYPFVPPYIGGEWALPDPAAYGENLVYEKADFRVSLSFADPANAPVVAASAPAALEKGTLVYSLPNARNFTISASPEFLVSSADANGITIYNYYFAANADAAAMVLELTRMSVNTYSAEFGPYPHAALSVCETDLNDGLETDGLYFLASNFYRGFDGSVKNNLSIIAVHETAHQWWYGVVANNQAEEPWLDEALSTYSEHVFYEDNYPDLISWWWNFRIYSQEATGWVDTRIYDTSSFRAYVNAVYFNGAHFLQSLRDRIGDRAFFAFLRDYYARNNGRIASAYDFFAILDLHTSVDISDLVQQFFQYR